LVCSTALLTGTALADRIPSSTKTSNTPSPAPISQFLAAQVGSLDSPNPVAQKQARDAMIYECSGHTGLPATPEYESLYATQVDRGLYSHAESASLRVRLNVAVIVAGVAAQTSHDLGSASGLERIVQKLLGDKQPAVVLWAAKAARYVLASDVEGGANPSNLANAVVAAVKDHADSGPIVEEAYASLTLEGLDKVKGGAPFQQNAGGLISATVDLIAWRSEQYKNGGSVPSPQADRPAMVFVSVTAFAVVNANPANLARALKVMGEFTCATARSMANGNASPELLEMIKANGNAFVAFGTQMQNAAVQNAGKAIEQMSQNTDPTKMNKMCDDLVAALKTVGVDIANNGPGAGQAAPAPAIAGN
jgi:hypothetical protein